MIGFGAIGSTFATKWREQPPASSMLVGVAMRSSQLDAAADILPPDTRCFTDVPTLLSTEPDCVIEAAGHSAIRDYGVDILRRGYDLMAVSVGALADSELREKLAAAAISGGSRILIPAGALAGFDGLRSLSHDRLASVTYTSTKPSRAWHGTPAAQAFELDSLRQRTVIFSGSALEAARLYPKNANLAAAVALAGIGFERTRVELVADPEATRNSGRIEAQSAGSRLTLEISSEPSNNPKTSLIVSASIIAALQNSVAAIRYC